MAEDFSKQEENKQNFTTTKEEADFYFNLGNEYYTQGEYNLAIDAYNKAINIKPDNPEIYHNAGIICIELDKYDLALDFLEKAISLDNKNDDTYYFLGHTYEICGISDKALENYGRAIALNPGHANASIAKQQLLESREQGTKDSDSFYEIAIKALESKEYNLAVENLELAIKYNPDNDNAYFELANLFYDKGDFYLSFDYFNKAISLKPSLSDNSTYKSLKQKLSDEKNAIKIITGLRDKLNNLSPKNRSLRVLRTSKCWNFDITNLNTIDNNVSSDIINCLIKDITPIPLMKLNFSSNIYDDMLDEDKNIKLQKKIFNHLNSLYRQINFIEAESGIYDLYVGYPFVECQCLDGTYIRAPLILNPCHLERVKDPYYGWILKTDNEFRPIFNDTLFMGLK
ncbi:MAG: tetratricopeptide repeat protein, partial [Cyanobacteriota bacterium]